MVTPHHTACTRVPYGGFTSRPVSRVGSTWSLPQDPPGASRYGTAHGMPARGDMVAAQVGVWVRGGFPQQRRLGSKLHPSLQVLQHPATAGGHKGRMPRVISARLDCSCLDRPVSPHTSGFSHKLLLLPSARSPTQGLRGAERGTKACQHAGTWLQHRLECGSEEASPSSGGLVRSSILPYKCCSTLPRPGDSGEWLPHVTPPGSRSPLEGPVTRSPHQGFGHTTTPFRQVPDPRPPGGRTRHKGIPARGHMVAAQVECGSEEASPSSGGLVRSSILPYKCCSTLPRPGDSGEWLPHVTPPGSRSPLEGPVTRSPHQGFGHAFTRTPLRLLRARVQSSPAAPHPKGTWVGAVAGLPAQDTVTCCQRGEIAVGPPAHLPRGCPCPSFHPPAMGIARAAPT